MTGEVPRERFSNGTAASDTFVAAASGHIFNPGESADAASLGLLANPGLDAMFLRPSHIGVPSAWYGHVPFAHWLVAAARPRTIVELGTHHGVSFAAFCEAVSQGRLPAQCTAIDTWQGDEHAGFYGDAVFDELRRFHEPRFGWFATLLRTTFDAARHGFADGSVDLLHIDGLHTYDAVRHDWENWRPTLSDRAVVLFHDVNERRDDFGVWRLWDELQAVYPAFTFLHSHGLGVLAVGGAVPDAVRSLCEADRDPKLCKRLRDRFAQLGNRWEAENEHSDVLRRHRTTEAQLAGIRAELAAAHAQVAEMRQNAEQAEARNQQVAADLRGEITRMQDDLVNVRTERDSAWTYQAWLEGEQHRLASELAQAHADLAQRAEDWERVHRVLAARDAELAVVRAEAAASR